MSNFTFANTTIVQPGILVRSTIGANQTLQLLPFGTLCFIGVSDGGVSGGTIYKFNDITSAKRLLRGGALYNALTLASQVGGASQLIAVVAGQKTIGALGGLSSGNPVNLVVNAAGVANIASGDQGTWVNSVFIKIDTGTSSGFAITVQFPDAITSQVTTVGGKGTAFDNLTNLTTIAAAITANSTLTPPASTGLPPIIIMTVTSNGTDTPKITSTTNYPASGGQQNVGGTAGTAGFVNLTGGTGNGSVIYDGSTAHGPGGGGGDGSSKFNLQDVQKCVDNLTDTAFDIGHIVGVKDDSGSGTAYNNAATAWAYADGASQTLAPLGNLRRWFHQVTARGVLSSQSRIINSAAVVTTLTDPALGAAIKIKSIRSSVVSQQVNILNPLTGQYALQDAAPVLCGMAALFGATGSWGPATPLTNSQIPGAVDVDWPVLASTGDQGTCINGGGLVLERRGTAVYVVQSVTTQPNDANGNPWVFSEFSVVRVSDALMANIKAAVQSNSPKAIGGGATAATLASLLAEAHVILELALQQGWITYYDPKSLTIAPYGSFGTDYILRYSAAPTLPLNHLAIDQTLIPFQAPITAQGQINP